MVCQFFFIHAPELSTFKSHSLLQNTPNNTVSILNLNSIELFNSIGSFLYPQSLFSSASFYYT